MNTVKPGVKSTELWVMVAPIILDKVRGLDASFFTSDQVVLLLLVYVGGRTLVKVSQILMAGYLESKAEKPKENAVG
jgi:hypothetical protein